MSNTATNVCFRFAHVVVGLVCLCVAAIAWPAAAQEAGGDAAPAENGETVIDLDADPLADIFLRLASDDRAVSARAQREIMEIWRDSGSASIDLLVLRSERAAGRQDWARAERHLTQIVNLDPDFAMGWMLRATVRFRAEEVGLALGDVAQALRLEPRQYEALALAALIYVQIGENEEALQAARAALAINPHLEEAQRVVDQLAPLVEGVDV